MTGESSQMEGETYQRALALCHYISLRMLTLFFHLSKWLGLELSKGEALLYISALSSKRFFVHQFAQNLVFY